MHVKSRPWRAAFAASWLITGLWLITVPAIAQTGAPQPSAPQPSAPQPTAAPAAAPTGSPTDAPMGAGPARTAPPALAAAPASPSQAAPSPDIPTSLLPRDLSVDAMFRNADAVVKSVLAGLITASVVTWTLLLGKGTTILLARRSAARALRAAEAETTLAALQLRLRALATDAIERAMTEATAAELQLSDGQDPPGLRERLASRLDRLTAAAGRRMARGTGVLATIGSTAPFVGLFGTVWGIMNSFIGISHAQTTNLAVVAPGIAEALLATATGLIAAIPAVVIYNVFARAIADYRAVLTDLAQAILRLVSRELDRRGSVRTAAAAE